MGAAPPLPGVVSSSGMTPTTTYYVSETYFINRVETHASAEASAVLADSSGFLDIFSPPAVDGASGYNVYLSTRPGQEHLHATRGQEYL